MKLADSASVETKHTLRCDSCGTAYWCSEECAQAHCEHGAHGVACDFLSTASMLLQDDDSAAVLELACGTLALRAKSQDKAERLVLAQSTDVALNASERRAAAATADLLLAYASSDDKENARSALATSFSRAIVSVAKEAEVQQNEEPDDGGDSEDGDDNYNRGTSSGSLTWWLRQMIRREKSNSFGHLMPADVTPPAKGSGLYPLLAAMNHSCTPNVR
eukprot:COSAG02_NODE_15310_length_1182_cov_1.500462_1_plen_219_part_00